MQQDILTHIATRFRQVSQDVLHDIFFFVREQTYQIFSVRLPQKSFAVSSMNVKGELILCVGWGALLRVASMATAPAGSLKRAEAPTKPSQDNIPGLSK